MIENSFCFDDVLIVPFFSKINSRKEVDISTRINNLKLSLPIISANMDTVTGNKMATARNISDFLFHSKSNETPNVFKVGIGGGSMCTTRIVTGCGMPTLQSVMDCYRYTNELGINIIADSGIKNSGDIVKALAAGADAVMVGSLLAGTEETPGELVTRSDPYGGAFYKKYRGSASKESYEAQNKLSEHRTPEGESTFVRYKGQVNDILQNLSAGVKSGLTYVGANNLTELKQNARFIKITNSGLIESKPHGKN